MRIVVSQQHDLRIAAGEGTREAPAPRECEMSKIEENKAAIARFIGAMQASDVATLGALTTEDFVWWILGKPEALPTAGEHSRDFFLKFFEGSEATFPEGVSFVPTSMIAEGNRVAVEAELDAVTATGANYNNRYHFMFELEGGKIRRMNEYMDTLHAKMVFGF